MDTARFSRVSESVAHVIVFAITCIPESVLILFSARWTAHDEKNSTEVANLITTDFMGLADTREKRAVSKITSQHLTDLANAILEGTISRRSAKEALSIMHEMGKPLSEIISTQNLARISGSEDLGPIIDEILAQEVQTVQTLSENPQAINYLVGKVMKKTNGKADPTTTLKLLREKTS